MAAALMWPTLLSLVGIHTVIEPWIPKVTPSLLPSSLPPFHHLSSLLSALLLSPSLPPPFLRLLKDKRATDESFSKFLELKRGAARHTLESLMLLPVSTLDRVAG